MDEVELKKKFKKVDSFPLYELINMESESKDKSREIFPLLLPMYVINTRDSFAFDLLEKITMLNLGGRNVKKIGKYEGGGMGKMGAFFKNKEKYK